MVMSHLLKALELQARTKRIRSGVDGIEPSVANESRRMTVPSSDQKPSGIEPLPTSPADCSPWPLGSRILFHILPDKKCLTARVSDNGFITAGVEPT